MSKFIRLLIVLENIIEVFEYFFLKVNLFFEVFVGIRVKEVKNLEKWNIINVVSLFLIFSKVFNFN